MTKAKARTTATATKLHEDDDNLVAEPVIVNFSAIDVFEMVIAPQHQRNALNTFQYIEDMLGEAIHGLSFMAMCATDWNPDYEDKPDEVAIYEAFKTINALTKFAKDISCAASYLETAMKRIEVQS